MTEIELLVEALRAKARSVFNPDAPNNAEYEFLWALADDVRDGNFETGLGKYIKTKCWDCRNCICAQPFGK